MTPNILDSAPISKVGLLVEHAGFERSTLRTLSSGTTLEVFTDGTGQEVKVFTPQGVALDGGLPDA